jgi:hypothetical protein
MDRINSSDIAEATQCSQSGVSVAYSSGNFQSTPKHYGPPSIVTDLPETLPVTDDERRLISVYLGDMIRQILSEPE